MSVSILNCNKIKYTISQLIVCIGIIGLPSVKAQSTPFNVNKPDKILTLDDQLVEISGIFMMPFDSVILAEQDEAGIIYTLDKESGKILRQVVIEETGDFEDITFVYPYVYLLKSKGKLYKINYKNPSDVSIFKSNLGKEQDTEGMGYDPVSKQLFIACKASRNPPKMFERDVFSFDIKTNSFSENPVFIIKRDDMADFLTSHPGIPDYDNLWSSYNKNNADFHLGPSGIAVDPLTNDIYVISSVGKVMMVFDHSAKLKDLIKLQKSIFVQPEGISFDTKGNLYISNEGKGGKGTIVFCKRGK